MTVSPLYQVQVAVKNNASTCRIHLHPHCLSAEPRGHVQSAFFRGQSPVAMIHYVSCRLQSLEGCQRYAPSRETQTWRNPPSLAAHFPLCKLRTPKKISLDGRSSQSTTCACQMQNIFLQQLWINSQLMTSSSYTRKMVYSSVNKYTWILLTNKRQGKYIQVNAEYKVRARTIFYLLHATSTETLILRHLSIYKGLTRFLHLIHSYANPYTCIKSYPLVGAFLVYRYIL